MWESLWLQLRQLSATRFHLPVPSIRQACRFVYLYYKPSDSLRFDNSSLLNRVYWKVSALVASRILLGLVLTQARSCIIHHKHHTDRRWIFMIARFYFMYGLQYGYTGYLVNSGTPVPSKIGQWCSHYYIYAVLLKQPHSPIMTCPIGPLRSWFLTSLCSDDLAVDEIVYERSSKRMVDASVISLLICVNYLQANALGE